MKTKREVNSFLSPTYWGSLAAFLTGLCGMFALAFFNGPLPHIVPTQAAGYAEGLVFYSTISIVVLFVVRTYLAVSVQMYGGSEGSVFDLPKPLRKVVFWFLSGLILLSSANAFVVGAIGVIPALVICVIQSGLSLFCVFALWVSHLHRPKTFPNVSGPQGFREIFFLGPILYLLISFVSPGGDGAKLSGMEVGFLVAFMFFFSLHEWRGVFAGPIGKQFRQLSEILHY